jgi:hypothetical protein
MSSRSWRPSAGYFIHSAGAASTAGVPGWHDQHLCMLPASPYRDELGSKMVTAHTKPTGVTGVIGVWSSDQTLTPLPKPRPLASSRSRLASSCTNRTRAPVRSCGSTGNEMTRRLDGEDIPPHQRLGGPRIDALEFEAPDLIPSCVVRSHDRRCVAVPLFQGQPTANRALTRPLTADDQAFLPGQGCLISGCREEPLPQQSARDISLSVISSEMQASQSEIPHAAILPGNAAIGKSSAKGGMGNLVRRAGGRSSSSRPGKPGRMPAAGWPRPRGR